VVPVELACVVSDAAALAQAGPTSRSLALVVEGVGAAAVRQDGFTILEHTVVAVPWSGEPSNATRLGCCPCLVMAAR